LCLHREPESDGIFEAHVGKTDAGVLTRAILNDEVCRRFWASIEYVPQDMDAREGNSSAGAAMTALHDSASSSESASTLPVHMTAEEQACISAFFESAQSYVEFGCGGSTVLASKLMTGVITSMDSSKEWIERVRAECQKSPSRIRPELIHVDIGPTGEWGRPLDESARDRWPEYSSAIWKSEGTDQADLYLIDGRFRVACFLETLMHCKADAVILIHDYTPRLEYHVVEEFARPFMTRGTLCAFIRRDEFDRAKAAHTLARFKGVPS